MRESPPTPLRGFFAGDSRFQRSKMFCFRVHVSMNERDVEAVLFLGSFSDRAGMFLYWPVLHRCPCLAIGFVLGVGFVLVTVMVKELQVLYAVIVAPPDVVYLCALPVASWVVLRGLASSVVAALHCCLAPLPVLGQATGPVGGCPCH